MCLKTDNTKLGNNMKSNHNLHTQLASLKILNHIRCAIV